MAMNDEETVALIAGGHTFGKTHGARDPATTSAPNPRRPTSRSRASAGRSSYGSGQGRDTPSPAASRSPGPPRRRSGTTSFFENLFGYEWELTKSPAGANQWTPKGSAGAGTVPDAHDRVEEAHAPHAHHRPGAALRPGLREDLAPLPRATRQLFADAFARAWFKLTHRDMGPRARYLGPLVPKEALIWQDPVPAVDHPLIDDKDVAALKAKMLASGPDACRSWSATAWASASTFRGTDKRGGANGARIRLAPQKDWEVNQPAQLAKVLSTLEAHPERVQRRADRRQEGLARRPDRARRQRGGRGRPRRRPGTT